MHAAAGRDVVLIHSADRHAIFYHVMHMGSACGFFFFLYSLLLEPSVSTPLPPAISVHW